ncbi:MAG: HAD-IC family P-type ATPase [Clostridiaceae bacterium]|nr:HAD-IC family P-type ATPase [Clostridiaceae bacterium]
MTPYKSKPEDVVEALASHASHGLTSDEAAARLAEHGPNRLEGGQAVSPLKIFLHNLNNLISYLLLAAAILSFSMGDNIEGIAVIIALLIAVLTGFFTELKAQKSVESLQQMIYTTAKVLRDGSLRELDSEQVVPGDILFLEEGDSVAADGRLVTSSNFACIESALTGESEAVEKDARMTFGEDTVLGDQVNMVFAGTAVTRGNATTCITATGMQTEVGKITGLLEGEKKQKTPLDQEMGRLSKLLVLVAFAAGIAVLVAGLVTSQPLEGLLHTALILAVAAIPEAMPAVSTITLSRGMKIMAEHKALVKSLPAVETLGSTSVICTDKTGTLTENQMTAERIFLCDGSFITIEGSGYTPEGRLLQDERVLTPEDSPLLADFIRAGVLCSNATLRQDEGEYQVIGDPTEGALVVLAEKTSLGKTRLAGQGWRRSGELPFDSAKKYMVTAYDHDTPTAFIKGAPDVLLGMSQQPEEVIAALRQANNELAASGMRVLAVGLLPDYAGDASPEALQNALSSVFILGLAGIMDPPRKDVPEAIRVCQEAGIQVKMITGDHPETASVIARDIGLANHSLTMSGQEIDRLAGKAAFVEKASRTAVFARVSPENKLQIVHALRDNGDVVAMTGDGVNDAPALNGADIGIAMGIRGTEVAKEASDMILTDDRFSTIVDAVREGRTIFANIKKYVSFLFSCNMVEIVTVLLSVLFLAPMPIRPLHILFLNLVIDIAPAMALAFEAGEKDIMSRPPRQAKGGLVNGLFLTRIVISGVVLGICAFLVFQFCLGRQPSLAYAQTATFTFMTVAQLLHIFNVRKEKGFGLDATLGRNKVLLFSLALSFLLQLAAVYLPFMNSILGTVPLDLTTWLVLMAAAMAATAAVYLLKQLSSRLSPRAI